MDSQVRPWEKVAFPCTRRPKGSQTGAELKEEPPGPREWTGGRGRWQLGQGSESPGREEDHILLAGPGTEGEFLKMYLSAKRSH